MATWLRMVDCACAECGSGPCNSGCCTFFASEFGGDAGNGVTTSYSYNVASQFSVSHDLSITFFPPPPALAAQLEVFADGVLLYDSGCVNGSNVSNTVSVPANTVSIVANVTECTAGPENEWAFDLACI